MAVLPEDIASQVRGTLAITDPELDTSVGGTPRKIIDALAEPIAEAHLDNHLLDYAYDVDAKSGDDLDEFCAVFSVYRLPARRATGTVVLERPAGVLTNVLVPFGTTFSTGGTSPVDVVTSVPAILESGDTAISIPASALIGGAAGNIPAASLVERGSPLQGISSFTNPVAFSGGADEESDEQLRLKFKRTVLRHLAGAEGMFYAVAADNEHVTHVNVIGAYKVFREQVEIVAGAATSVLTGAKHVYDYNVFGPSIEGGQIFTEGIQYNFASTDPPTIAEIGALTPDGIYDLEFRYTPDASRNDPANNVEDKIDIYVAGKDPESATQQLLFSTALVFNTTAGHALNRTRFRRTDGALPTSGNYLIPLAFAPVLDPSINDSITIDGVDYSEGVDYFFIDDISETGGTPRSNSGIEWKSAANGGVNLPTAGDPFTVEYVFNRVPLDIEAAIESWRLTCTDVAVHQAQHVLLNFNLAIILTRGSTLASVEGGVEQTLARYVERLGFTGILQISDIIEVVHGVPGVDAVRFLNSGDDPTDYAIQKMSETGVVLDTFDDGGAPARAIDVLLTDSEVPVFNAVSLTVKAQNSFGGL